ncbi:P-loop containing nucleoside triphosphate hydrolase protein [Rhizophagus diaphanus]|nr:P-loop containing nucleoside triphosphate hydrolase protein [Rhizophagus diaphanus] [Rhizophagus sp. MUCL 43196]
MATRQARSAQERQTVREALVTLKGVQLQVIPYSHSNAKMQEYKEENLPNPKNNQDDAPTEEETRYVQVEGLIRHLLDDHSICWSDVCWLKDNPELQLQVGQGIVTTLRTSHNETFNRKILKYLDKRIDYWASYSARHALAVIDQNDGLDAMISKVCVIATGVDFSYSDICNILKFVQERSRQVIKNRSAIQQRNEARKEQYASERKELAGFDFDKELVSYKSKVSEQIYENIFWPSFGELLTDFDVIVKCVAYHAFAKKSSRGLCGICSFYVDAGLWEQIVNNKYIPKGQQPEKPKKETLILLAATKIFGFEKFRSEQLEAINAYLNGNDTFVSMKTGGRKTLCYALSAVCSEGLTIIFSPLKALMEDQKRELVKAGIPCAVLYANLTQGTRIQEKIFEKIASGLIKVLFVTSEKLVSNEGFCRKAWTQLGMLKQRWKSVPIMLLTATCTRSEVDEILANLTIEKNKVTLICDSTSHRSEIIFNVQERKEIHDQYITNIIDIINRNLHGRIIIYYATRFNCECLHNKLQESLTGISIDYFHDGLRDDERETAINNWKSNHTQIIVATSAFGMGINSNNILVVIYAEASMSITNLIQEAGRAGPEYRETESIIDISTNEQNLTNKLERAANKIFEVFYYCISQYECCQQLIWQYQAWPDENKPSVCNKCDNCIKRIANKLKLLDGKEEIMKLLEVVEFLLQEEQVSPDDVVDVFRGGKTARVKQKKWDTLPIYPSEKRKVLKTKELVQFALADLVVRGLVLEKIILRKPFEGGTSLSSSIVIAGVMQGVQANANMQTWNYFVK